MKKKKASITLLSALMLIFVNLFTMPAWAEQGDVVIDDTNFPDEIFRSYVSKFDKNNDNILSQSELDAVKGIKVSAKKLKLLRELSILRI